MAVLLARGSSSSRRPPRAPPASSQPRGSALARLGVAAWAVRGGHRWCTGACWCVGARRAGAGAPRDGRGPVGGCGGGGALVHGAAPRPTTTSLARGSGGGCILGRSAGRAREQAMRMSSHEQQRRGRCVAQLEEWLVVTIVSLLARAAAHWCLLLRARRSS